MYELTWHPVSCRSEC